MTKSLVISSIILLCAAIIESSILSNISFFLVVPDLVLICSIYFALANGKVAGETTGFISGLILDFITGIPFGFNCLYRTIIGYLYGLLHEKIIISSLVIPIFCVGVGTLIKAVLIHLIALLFPNVNIYVTGFISYEFLFEFVENIVIAPFIFRFLKFFNKAISIRNSEDNIENV